MDKKWCFIDLDGTLLNKTKKIDKSNLNSLKKYLDSGNEVVLTTGRWPISALIYNNEIQKFVKRKNSYLISLNGAYIIDLKNDEVMFYEAIENKTFNKLLEFQKKFSASMWIYTENGIKNNIIYCKKIPFKWIVSKFNYGKVKSYMGHEAFTDNKIKILFMSLSPKKINKLFISLTESLSEELSIIKTSNFNIEITNKNINKGTGLNLVKQKAKININQMVAFGDSGNDVDMFKNSGYRYAFSKKNENLTNVANKSYPNNKVLKDILEDINNNKHIIEFKKNLSIFLSIDKLKALEKDYLFNRHSLIWNFIVNQYSFFLQASNYPNWLLKSKFDQFLLNKNFVLISSNNNCVFSEKEKKFIFAKSFSDTQTKALINYLEKNSLDVFVIEKNNLDVILVCKDNQSMKMFIEKHKINKNIFTKIFNINEFKIKEELNNIISFSSYKNELNHINENFKIFKQDDFSFLYINKQNYKNSFSSTKNFTIKNFEDNLESLNQINNFLYQNKK